MAQALRYDISMLDRYLRVVTTLRGLHALDDIADERLKALDDLKHDIRLLTPAQQRAAAVEAQLVGLARQTEKWGAPESAPAEALGATLEDTLGAPGALRAAA